MPEVGTEEQVRPCDVVVKLLMNKHAAPFTKDEIEILDGYLRKLQPHKLGGFAKKRIAEMSDEEFGDLIKAKIDGVLKSARRSR